MPTTDIHKAPRLGLWIAGALAVILSVAAATGIDTSQTLTAAPSSVNLSSVSAAEGSSDAHARADHTHPISGTLPEARGGTGAGALTCTNQFLTSNGTAQSCSTDTLAGAQHANQGTTTTLLHGNAAGNPSWAQVGLTTDVSGVLVQGNGGTGSGALTCSAGQFLTSNGSAYSCGTPTAGGWATALDCDLTAESSQTLTTDGTYTICGLTWTKENSAHDRVAMAVTNGTGLVIQPKITPDYNDYVNATRSAPLVWIPLSQLGITNLSWATGIRVWAYISASNTSTNFDNAVVAVDGDNMQWSYNVGRGRNGGGADGFIIRRTIAAGTSANVYVNATLGAANNVAVVQIPSLSGPIFAGLFGQYSAGWPTEANLTFQASIGDGTTQTAASGPAAGNAAGNYGIVLAACTATSNNNLSITYARVRIDYHL